MSTHNKQQIIIGCHWLRTFLNDYGFINNISTGIVNTKNISKTFNAMATCFPDPNYFLHLKAVYRGRDLYVTCCDNCCNYDKNSETINISIKIPDQCFRNHLETYGYVFRDVFCDRIDNNIDHTLVDIAMCLDVIPDVKYIVYLLTDDNCYVIKHVNPDSQCITPIGLQLHGFINVDNVMFQELLIENNYAFVEDLFTSKNCQKDLMDMVVCISKHYRWDYKIYYSNDDNVYVIR